MVMVMKALRARQSHIGTAKEDGALRESSWTPRHERLAIYCIFILSPKMEYNSIQFNAAGVDTC